MKLADSLDRFFDLLRQQPTTECCQRCGLPFNHWFRVEGFRYCYPCRLATGRLYRESSAPRLMRNPEPEEFVVTEVKDE